MANRIPNFQSVKDIIIHEYGPFKNGEDRWTQSTEESFIYKIMPLYAAGFTENIMQYAAEKRQPKPLKDLITGYLNGLKKRKVWNFEPDIERLRAACWHVHGQPPWCGYLNQIRKHKSELVKRFGDKAVVVYPSAVPGYNRWGDKIGYTVFSTNKVLPQVIFRTSDTATLIERAAGI